MDNREHLFTIQQVSTKLNIPKPTLRFWEVELDGIIAPLRTSGGHRRYSVTTASTIEDIKKLREKGMSLAEIRMQFSNNKEGDHSDLNNVDLLAERIADVVKAEVYSFFKR